MPAWWRRFMFAVLSPRDFVIYAYICSNTDQFGIAYPTYANMKADLNISDARIIKQSLDKLVEYGFLLVKHTAPLRLNKHPRNVYQRPCVEFTLRLLLDKNAFDADLRPRHCAEAARKGDNSNRDSQVVYFGLRRLFTDNAWKRITSALPKERVTVLSLELQYIIDQKRLKWKTEDAPQISAADRQAAEANLYHAAEDNGVNYSAFPDFDADEANAAHGDGFDVSADDSSPFYARTSGCESLRPSPV
jgi:hypothetical protein